LTTPDLDTREHITDVLIRYATGIDSRDWELFRTCFTDDCDADYGDTGHWRSGHEITEWMAQTHDPLGPTLHRITNVALTQQESGWSSRCYVHAVVMMPDLVTAVHAYGWYDDHLVPMTGGWRIARRRFTPVTTEVRGPS
jgi:3-phenylpropionate/cinnamic acid dioxygenase small subunit